MCWGGEARVTAGIEQTHVLLATAADSTVGLRNAETPLLKSAVQVDLKSTRPPQL